MGTVVPFPAKRPHWLLLVDGRLMVRYDRPLADLHRMARLAGVTRKAYRSSPVWPYYRLSTRAASRCVRIFGRMPTEPAILSAALELADRRRGRATKTTNVP